MSRRTPIVLATVLALLVSGLTATPVSADTKRYKKLEWVALRLINCTRTGGRVKADGTCKGYGSGRFSRYRRPLKMHRRISNEVAYPWAKRIAKAR